MSVKVEQIGDMQIIGDPFPGLRGELASLARDLHRLMGKAPFLASPDYSKSACVWASLTARDFLAGKGFEAEVMPVIFHIIAFDHEDRQIHSLAIGHPDDTPISKAHWVGHMVVLVKDVTDQKSASRRFMLDTTLYQVARPAWPSFPGMLAIDLALRWDPKQKITYSGRPSLMSLRLTEMRHKPPARVLAHWFTDEQNRAWVDGGDAKPERRHRIVQKLLLKTKT